MVARRLPLVPVATLALALLVIVSAPAGVGAARPHAIGARAGEWTTVGGNFDRWSDDAVDPSLDPLRQAWVTAKVNGSIYGAALIWHGVVYAATEQDTVYAFRARTGAVLWSRRLATPVPASRLPCGDIKPDVGITSTMVIDPATGQLFASGEVLASGAVRHYVFGLDAANGAVEWRRDIDPAGWVAKDQLQRTGLALADGYVLAGFAGNAGDCGTYHGEVIAAPETGTGSVFDYQVPAYRQAGIWAPSGITVDPAGDIFVTTGNGASRSPSHFDYSDSVLELQLRRNPPPPAKPGLSLVQYFAPSSWLYYGAHDEDLSSTAPILLGNGQIVAVGKERVMFLLDASHLGGIGGQLAQKTICFATGGNAYAPPSLYVGCLLNHVTQVRVGPGDTLTPGWTTAADVGGPPTIAGGLVWSVNGRTGVLYGLNRRTGAEVISERIGSPITHFPLVSSGEGLLVATGGIDLVAFTGPAGILSP
jgi:outer membrane protein assembly factor BamB